MKTTVILGAGFSKNIGIPIQDDLLSGLISHISHTGTKEQKENWKRFNSFFSKTVAKEIGKFKLEDIFTIFDKCILDNESFKGIEVDQIRSWNKYLLGSLRQYLNNICENKFNTALNDAYLDFASEVIRARASYGEKDCISFVDLNWDNYFEKILTYYKNSHRTVFPDMQLDYCTYDTSYDNRGLYIPSILKKASGKQNLKILKPHGSINWGYCPNCGRLYISFGTKIHTKMECIKYCNKKYKTKTKLMPIMITPTFLKDIQNQHLKGIWQNIGIEISESDSIVFIGYSLRPEDYYFRFTLAKYFSPSKKIFVFDYIDPLSSSLEKAKYATKNKINYDNFFQQSSPTMVYINGWEENIRNIIKIANGEDPSVPVY